MKIISFIDQDELIERILRHLGLPARSCLAVAGGWDTCLRATHRQARNHDPPAKSAAHIPELTYLPVRDCTQTGDDSYSQLFSEPEAAQRLLAPIIENEF